MVRLAPAGRAVLLLGIAATELAGRRFTLEGRRISAVRFGRVALLIAYVDREAFSPEAIETLRTDPARLALEAGTYQRAIERAAVHAPIAPAGLLTVYADMAPHAMPAFDPYPIAVSARAARMPKADYGADPSLAPHLEAVWKAVVPFAVGTRKLKPVSKRERFGVAILVEPAAIDRLRATLGEHAAGASALGLTWYCEGPRLPFSFV